VKKIMDTLKTLIINSFVITSVLFLLIGLFLGMLSQGSIELLFYYFKGNLIAVLFVGFLGMIWISLTGMTITSLALPEPAVSKITGILFGAGSVSTGLALVVITFFLSCAVAIFLIAFSFLLAVLALFKRRRIHPAIGVIAGIFFILVSTLLGYLGSGPPKVVFALICAGLWGLLGILYCLFPIISIFIKKEQASAST
ncbi:MAG: hypothetical protein QW728_00485, partial [Thermoplasmata archaeon]